MNDIRYRTAIHEAGHAVTAICLGLRPVVIQLETDTKGWTEVHADGPLPVDRLREQTYRSYCTTACAGNAAVRHVVSQEAADAELADQPDLAIVDRERAQHWAKCVIQLTGEPIEVVVAAAQAEVGELFKNTGIDEAIRRVADALLAAGGVLEETAIRVAFDDVGP